MPQAKARPHAAEEFLIKFPEFQFDVREHLASMLFAPAIAREIRKTASCFRRPKSRPEREDDLLRRFRQEIAIDIPAHRRQDSPKRFQDLPLTDKHSVRSRLLECIRPDIDLQAHRRMTTSGTSGPPLTVVYSPAFYVYNQYVPLWRAARRAGIRRIARRPVLGLCIVEAPAPDVLLCCPVGERLVAKVAVRANDSRSATRFARMVQTLRPNFIIGIPSAFETVLSHMDPPSFPARPQALFSSGAILEDGLRRRMEQFFGAGAYSLYGLNEVGVIGSECNQQQGFHINEESVHVEVVDEDGRPLPEGSQGELVVSRASNEAMPFIRYRTGDWCAVATQRCACGAEGVRITQLFGRRFSCFPLGSGALWSPIQLKIFGNFPVKEFQITQTSLRMFKVAVDLEESLADHPKTLEAIRRFVESSIPERVRVTVEQRKIGKNGKFQRFRSFVGSEAWTPERGR